MLGKTTPAKKKNKGSFKKLYFKFITITMSFVTIVLVCVLAVSYGVVTEQNSRSIGEALKTAVLMGSSANGIIYATNEADLLSYLSPQPTDNTNQQDQKSNHQQTTTDNSTDTNQQLSVSAEKLPKIGAQKAYIPMMVFHVDPETSTITPSSTASSTAQIDGAKMLALKSATESAEDGYSKDTSQGLLFFKRTLPDGTYDISVTDTLYVDDYSNRVFVAFTIVAASCWIAFFVLACVLLRIVIKPVEESCRKQNRFVTDVSHELKTPIAVMMADSEILMTTNLTKEQRRWVEATLDEANKMKSLVEELLELSKEAELDAGGTPSPRPRNSSLTEDPMTLSGKLSAKASLILHKAQAGILEKTEPDIQDDNELIAQTRSAACIEAQSGKLADDVVDPLWGVGTKGGGLALGALAFGDVAEGEGCGAGVEADAWSCASGLGSLADENGFLGGDKGSIGVKSNSLDACDGGVSTEAVLPNASPFRKRVQKSVMAFDSLAFERGVEISFSDGDEARGLAPVGDTEAIISAKSLDRLLGILLDNATKYAEGDFVRVVVWGERGRVAVAVTNASSISDKEAPLMFDRFYRADTARTRGKESSFGLGLSMARAIVDDCGGKIKAFKSGGVKENLTIEVKLVAKK